MSSHPDAKRTDMKCGGCPVVLSKEGLMYCPLRKAVIVLPSMGCLVSKAEIRAVAAKLNQVAQ